MKHAIVAASLLLATPAMAHDYFVQHHYQEVTYTETVVDAEDALIGALIGGIIGNNVGNADGNGAAGAVVGGVIGGTSTVTKTKNEYTHSTITFQLDGKTYTLEFQRR